MRVLQLRWPEDWTGGSEGEIVTQKCQRSKSFEIVLFLMAKKIINIAMNNIKLAWKPADFLFTNI